MPIKETQPHPVFGRRRGLGDWLSTTEDLNRSGAAVEILTDATGHDTGQDNRAVDHHLSTDVICGWLIESTYSANPTTDIVVKKKIITAVKDASRKSDTFFRVNVFNGYLPFGVVLVVFSMLLLPFDAFGACLSGS